MMILFESRVATTVCCLVFAVAVFAGCKDDDNHPGPIGQPDPITIEVNTDNTYQTIAGFGGSNRMWGTQFLEPEEAEKAFSTGENGLGLSLFRIRIASNDAEWPRILESAQEAQSRGVKILASPWSPPAELKSNNSDVGGYLLTENYSAFKDHINAFISYMSDNGIDIYAISIQNEPDIQVSYESCDWTASQMIDFLSAHGDQIEGAKIAAPESYNFNPSFTNALLNNGDVVENLDIVAGHIYGGGLGAFPLAEQKEKEVWMTEYLMHLNYRDSGDWANHDDATKWDESLAMLNTVHEAMTYNWNAYIWWYLQRFYSFIGDGEEGTPEGQILKRGYAFSHFSKFVRPGYVRVGTQASQPNNLNITAYTTDGQAVVVIINDTDEDVVNLNIDIPELSAGTEYVTTVNLDRQKRTSEITDGKAVVDIRPKSVTTVVLDM